MRTKTRIEPTDFSCLACWGSALMRSSEQGNWWCANDDCALASAHNDSDQAAPYQSKYEIFFTLTPAGHQLMATEVCKLVGVRDVDGDCEQVADPEAEFWSLYRRVHLHDLVWGDDWIGDYTTRDDAEADAARRGLWIMPSVYETAATAGTRS